MRNTLRLLTVAFAAVITLASCSKDTNFGAGWDEQLIDRSVTIDQNTSDDIDLGTINFDDIAAEYIAQNHSDAKSYLLIEARPQFGAVSSTQVLPLGFVEGFDIYAISGSEEVLIGLMNSGSSQDATFGISGLDVNLSTLSGSDWQIVARPTFNDLGTGFSSVEIEVTYAFSFKVDGSK